MTANPAQTALGAVDSLFGLRPSVRLISAGRSSQAWLAELPTGEYVVRVPIPESGRLMSYRSEALVTSLLRDAGHPVCDWRIVFADGVECSVGRLLPGSRVRPDQAWPMPFTDSVASLLRCLHDLPAGGWGPLQNRSDRLAGLSHSPRSGVIDRWFHAHIWPFDRSTLDTHPLALLEPDLLPDLARLEADVATAACGPYGVVHSDLHPEHLLIAGDQLAGVLDFGDAFVGSTAWDFALLRWYYGDANANRVANAYGANDDLVVRSSLLALAVGCYKVAKSPSEATRSRLRELVARHGATATRVAPDP